MFKKFKAWYHGRRPKHGKCFHFALIKKKGSVVDEIRMVLGCRSSAANTFLSPLFALSQELGTLCARVKINGKGNETPVADAKTLVRIVWLLLGKKHMNSVARARKRCAVCSEEILVSFQRSKHGTLPSRALITGARPKFLLNGRQEEEEAVDAFIGVRQPCSGISLLKTGRRSPNK